MSRNINVNSNFSIFSFGSNNRSLNNGVEATSGTGEVNAESPQSQPQPKKRGLMKEATKSKERQKESQQSSAKT